MQNSQPKHYQTVGLGGTFDHFHIGHHHFLRFAAQMGKRILIGVTTSELSAGKTAPQFIEPLDVRIQAVKEYLSAANIDGEVFVLDNPYGPTLEHSIVDAVAVTEQTVEGAKTINQKRQQLGLPPLPFAVCKLLRDETNQLISSTRIRLGQINRNGKVYAKLFAKTLALTSDQLKHFTQPQGHVVSELELTAPMSSGQHILVAAVGDVVVDTFLRHHLPFQLAVFDRKSQRSAYHSELIENELSQAQVFKVTNPAHVITRQLGSWLQTYLSETDEKRNDRTFLEVDGEEDLVTVALATLAPLGTIIYYGQPNQGIVQLIVTEELKERFVKVLLQKD